MFCPNCKSETIKILEDHYCPNCKDRIHSKQNFKKNALLGLSKPPKAVVLGFLSTFFMIFILFIMASFFLDSLTGTARNILLIFVGIISAFFGGAISYKIDAKNYKKNAFILASTLVFINAIFYIYNFNIISLLLSVSLGILIYPMPFLAGGWFLKKTKIF